MSKTNMTQNSFNDWTVHIVCSISVLFLFCAVLYTFIKPPYPILNHANINVEPLYLTEKHVKLSAIGDILMHIPVKKSARAQNVINKETGKSINNKGFDFLFEKVKDEFLDSDITLGNMEFPVEKPYISKPFKFNCEPEVLHALKDAKINLLNVANNHSYDQGRDGFVSTLEHLEAVGIKYIGGGHSYKLSHRGTVLIANDVRIGFIGYTGVFNDQLNVKNKTKAHVNDYYDENTVLKDIKEIRARCDLLVMSVHMGIEYSGVPTKRDKKLCRKYLDSGVDIIIGHHPHVLQPFETYVTKDNRKTYIFYSLGNFISNQSRNFNPSKTSRAHSSRNRESIIARMEIVKLSVPYVGSLNHTIIQKFEFVPIWTENYVNKTKKHIIRPVLLDKRLKVAKLNGNKKKSKLFKRLRKEIFDSLNLTNRTKIVSTN